jgi:hypothetical protein
MDELLFNIPELRLLLSGFDIIQAEKPLEYAKMDEPLHNGVIMSTVIW